MTETSIEFWGIKGFKLMRKAGVTLPTFKEMIPNIDELKNAHFTASEIGEAVHKELLNERQSIIDKIKEKAAKFEASKKKS